MASPAFEMQWLAPHVDGDHRWLLRVGGMHCAAVFDGTAHGARGIRWRAWVTKNMNPVDGVSGSLETAKADAEARVAEALALLGMRGCP